MNTLSIDNFPTTKNITNLEDFIQRQNEIQKQVEAWVIKWWRHMKFLEYILELQKTLILFFWKHIDPIDFLHILYYIENQSFETICSTIKNIYNKSNQEQKIFFTGSAIQKFARDRLNWKLKNQRENKNTFTYRTREVTPTLKELRNKEEEKKEIDFLKWFIENSKNINLTLYDQEKISKFQYLYEKWIYILKYIYWIEKSDFLKLKELWLWTPFIASNLNKKFREDKISFLLNEATIRRIFLNINIYDSI